MRSAVLGLTVSVVLAGVAPAQTPEKAPRPGIANYSRLDARFACGGATEPAAFAGLKAEGFSAVINLRTAGEQGAEIDAGRAAAEQAGLEYIHIPLSNAAPTDEAFDAFMKAVTDPANQPLFIHCGSANRVGAVWIAKRMLVDGWPAEKAVAEAKTIGLRSEPLEKFALAYVEKHKRP